MLEQKVVDILTQLQNAVVSYAPKAWQIAVVVKRVDCLQSLILGLVLVGGTVGLGLFTKKMLGKVQEDELDTTSFFGVIFGGIAFVGCGIAASSLLLNLWNWIGVFDPSFALTHDLYRKVMGQ